MTTPSVPILSLLALTSTLSVAQIDRARVVTGDLDSIEGTIITLDESGIQLQDDHGVPSRLDWSKMLGMSVLMPINEEFLRTKILDENTLVFVDTVDGQRLFMTLLDSENPDFILGSMGPTRVKIALEYVRRVWRLYDEPIVDPINRVRESEDNDRIHLTNGDDITGFILSIGSIVTIEPSGSDGGIFSIPLNQTRAVRLANPETRREFMGLYLHTDLGLTFHASMFSMDPESGDLTMTLSPGVVEYDPDSEPIIENTETNWPGFDPRLASVEIRHPDRWVVDPLESDTHRITPTGDRSWTPQPEASDLMIEALSTGTLRMLAPTRLETQIQPNSSRLRCLYTPDPGAWSDHIASIEAIDARNSASVLWSKRMTGSDSPAVIDVQIPNGTRSVAFVIDPGANGPIQDSGTFSMIRMLVLDQN